MEMSSKIMRLRSEPEKNTLGPTFYHRKMFDFLVFSKLKLALRIDTNLDFAVCQKCLTLSNLEVIKSFHTLILKQM